ncbi:prephenate dehydratase [Ophiostoma piceae UAMH 11346]|uniref:prephenate dehydratase n=1 Tax=Ophiostoma piceae (strain UAMH 11346) TaxID=1262450 RepID=S3C602_OPHP1|nr:prephenate dehydratase [Ophiostoma piceae UAMH 11346]
MASRQTVAFLGPVTSYTHQATMSAFGPDHDLVPVTTIKDVFETVQKGDASYGVVPFENSTHGPVTFTLAGLADRDGAYAALSVCGEVYLAVHHFLLGRADKESLSSSSPSQTSKEDGVPLTSLSHIKRIYSHPQAFGQTTAFVRKYFGTSPPEMIDTSSTSRAAELAAADESGTSAAISSALAAETTGLDVLARCIEDRPDNTTRFFVLTTQPSGAPTPLKQSQLPALASPKSLVSFTVPHRSPGALADVLDCFRRAGLNLTSINSLPSLIRPFQYLFFVEFEHGDEEKTAKTDAVDGTRTDTPHERVQRVLGEVAKLAQTYRLLGTWNKPESL